MSKDERTVAFGVVDEAKVGEHVQRQQKDPDISLGRIIDGVPQFIQVGHHPTFRAEYFVQDGTDIIIHFFKPLELQLGTYWTSMFPRALDSLAQAYFQATRPRLQAKYTEAVDERGDSWWFKARGYGHIFDLKTFIHAFFDSLDAALSERGLA